MVSFKGFDFDYGRAMEQARSLDEIASQIRNSTARNIENTMNELGAGWKGEAAESYVHKGMELSEKVEKVARDLENAADTIRSIARRIENAERAVVSIVNRKG